MKIKILPLLLIPYLYFLSIGALADVRLPRLVSDGMVLQSQAEVKIWGWADAGESVSVHFVGRNYSATANKKGEWQITLPEMKPGGPFTMEIKGRNRLQLNDILIGEVWVASGQSNMQLNMARAEPLYPDEVKNVDLPRIRHFTVPERYDFRHAQKDLESGSWKKTTPENIRELSAVAHFFAKDLHTSYGTPVGIINASLGGSPVEAWISEDSLKQFPDAYAESRRFRNANLIKQIEAQDRQRNDIWHSLLDQRDKGLDGAENLWASEGIDTAEWSTMEIPGYWPQGPRGPLNGSVWFRKTVDIPADAAGQSAKLILGRIVDADVAFVNGTRVGSTGYQYPPRRYEVPAGLLREGENTIAVRVTSQQGRGGFVFDKDYELQLADRTFDLAGDWHYRIGAVMEPLESPTFIRWKPVGLHNGMIAPLLNYRIKGVIWYQGESNVANADQYGERFATMIKDWRSNWNQQDFPFLFVQLANFLEPNNQPTDSNWARLREAQLETLRVPGTAMAVAIDIGEWNDIHPLNKQTVGQRLAAAAHKLAYGKGMVYSGPIFESATVTDKEIVLSFNHKGSGLVAKDGKLRQFAIAGKDRKFVWADAEIRGDKVVVWSSEVEYPIAVRYAWSDNPEGANLYNKEGFPASPFRTDNW